MATDGWERNKEERRGRKKKTDEKGEPGKERVCQETNSMGWCIDACGNDENSKSQSRGRVKVEVWSSLV